MDVHRGVNAKNVNNYLGYNQIIAVGGTWMCKSDKIKAGAWDEITAMSKEAVNVMLGLELGHIGTTALTKPKLPRPPRPSAAC